MSKTTVSIGEEFKVEIDQYNHTLYQHHQGGEVITAGKYKGQVSKPRWVEIGHFPKMSWVLQKVVFLKSLSGESVSLDSYLSRLEELSKTFESMDFKLSEQR